MATTKGKDTGGTTGVCGSRNCPKAGGKLFIKPNNRYTNGKGETKFFHKGCSPKGWTVEVEGSIPKATTVQAWTQEERTLAAQRAARKAEREAKAAKAAK